MQAKHGTTTLADTLEGHRLGVSDGRDVDSYVATGAAAASVGRAVASPPVVTFSTRRACDGYAGVFAELLRGAMIDDSARLTLTEEDGSMLMLKDACLSQYSATCSGLSVSGSWSFTGDALMANIFVDQNTNWANPFDTYVINEDVTYTASATLGGYLDGGAQDWTVTNGREQTLTIEDCTVAVDDDYAALRIYGYGEGSNDGIATISPFDTVTVTIAHAKVGWAYLYADYGHNNNTTITLTNATWGDVEDTGSGSIYMDGKVTLTVDNSTIISGTNSSFANYCAGGTVRFLNGATYSPANLYPVESSSGADGNLFSVESGAVLTTTYLCGNCFSSHGNTIRITGEDSKIICSGYVYPLPGQSSGGPSSFELLNGGLLQLTNGTYALSYSSWFTQGYYASSPGVNRIRFGGGYMAIQGDVRGTCYGKIGYQMPLLGTVITGSDGSEWGTATYTGVQVRAADGTWADAHESDLTITYCATAEECSAATGGLYALADYTIIAGGASL